MKCTECPKWDKKEECCNEVEHNLEGDCILRNILWQLDIMTGALEESLADTEEDEGEWWKNK